MIDIVIHEGAIVPGRRDIPGISFKDAMLGMSNMMAESILTETVEGTPKTIIQKIKIALSNLMKKVLGFFRGIIDKIRGYTLNKTKYILKNKKAILSYNDTKFEMLLPVNLLKPKNTISIEWFYESVNGVIGAASTAMRTGEIPDTEKTVGLPPKLEQITDKLIRRLFRNHNTHIQTRQGLKIHIYGQPHSVIVGEMNKKLLLERFVETDKMVNSLQTLYDNANKNLTLVMKDLGYAGYSKDLAQNVTDDIVGFYIDSYGAILHVTNLYISILMDVYNIMYAVMDHMIKNNPNTKK